MRGESKAASETVVTTNLRRQGIRVVKIKRQSFRGGRKVSEKDITFFTRQLATMLKAGVPLLQAFEIVARGHSNARFSRLMMDIKSKIEAGSSPVAGVPRASRASSTPSTATWSRAGETSGTLDAILDRLATYKEKILAIKSKIKSALFYPISVIVVAIVVVWVIMVWVIPSFKKVFTSFGADLPAPTLIVMAISDFVVAWWWLVFMVHRRHDRRLRLRAAPAIGRVPLRVRPPDAQDSRSSAASWRRRRSRAGRARCRRCSRPACRWSNRSTPSAARPATRSTSPATSKIQTEVSTGTSLTNAMANTKLFPTMVLQMTQIGEESGSLDNMLGKIADFFEREVDDAVAALSSLLEPIIIVFLGVVIGGLVVAMYLPIFKLGAVI